MTGGQQRSQGEGPEAGEREKARCSCREGGKKEGEGERNGGQQLHRETEGVWSGAQPVAGGAGTHSEGG